MVTVDMNAHFAHPIDVSFADVVDDVHLAVGLIDQLANYLAENMSLGAIDVPQKLFIVQLVWL